MEITRIFDLLPYYERTFKPKEDVIASKENGHWVKYSIRQYRETVDNISLGFLALGVKPGDAIAQISDNRAEWNFVDMAIQQAVLDLVRGEVIAALLQLDEGFFQHRRRAFCCVERKAQICKLSHRVGHLRLVLIPHGDE